MEKLKELTAEVVNSDSQKLAWSLVVVWFVVVTVLEQIVL